MRKREKTALEIEDDFDSAEVPTENIKAMCPISELLEKKRMEPPPEETPKVSLTAR